MVWFDLHLLGPQLFGSQCLRSLLACIYMYLYIIRGRALHPLRQEHVRCGTCHKYILCLSLNLFVSDHVSRAAQLAVRADRGNGCEGRGGDHVPGARRREGDAVVHGGVREPHGACLRVTPCGGCFALVHACARARLLVCVCLCACACCVFVAVSCQSLVFGLSCRDVSARPLLAAFSGVRSRVTCLVCAWWHACAEWPRCLGRAPCGP